MSDSVQQREFSANFFKALAHSTRLFIVEQLSDGEKCVYELTDMIDADMSTVSRHLAVLKNSGIVSSCKRGNQVFYSLRTPCILNFLQCIHAPQGQG